MKSRHAANETNSITGSTKQHIASRLHKASTYAAQLVTLLEGSQSLKSNTEAILEARAYYVSLLGARDFEKQHWQQCLHNYSEGRLIYRTLANSKSSQGEDLFRDLLNTTIDPSIRYAAYQQKTPRTTSIDAIVSKFAPDSNSEYMQAILKLNPKAIDDPTTSEKDEFGSIANSVPKTVKWRSRTVNLEDAMTAQALAAVYTAEEDLLHFLQSNPDAGSKARGAAYDGVLIPSQDAVDSTKTAIDELKAEGISQSDHRMQSLQITRTAVNYALVGWRVGRNRVLCGDQDGATMESITSKRRIKNLQNSEPKTERTGSNGSNFKRLKERLVLYESILQSLDSIKELPGVAADQPFLDELAAKKSYFAALKCLTIARSHSLLQDRRNALALLSRALNMISHCSPQLLSPEHVEYKALNLDVTIGQVKALRRLLESLLFQHRALVELHNLDKGEVDKKEQGIVPPLVERLDEYALDKVDLTNLVTYPPRVEAIPVKPLFLDVAFNYIDYPGRAGKPAAKAMNGVADGQASKEEKKEGRRGWFGFGR